MIDLEREHYHFIIGAKGEVVEGLHAPERNGDPSAGDYAAHTLNANTGAIGISIDAMAGAQERPFHWGSQPMTWRQIEALAQLTAVLSDRFWIPVSRYSTLSHSEVQPTLGIRQRWKWDINVLPDMAAPGDPLEVGDRIREMVREHMSGQPAEPTEPVAPEPTPEIPAGMARKAAAFDRIASIVNDT